MTSIKKEIINITPDKSLYSKLGQTGYTIGESIAELVDNAIDARYDNKQLNIYINLDVKNQKIIIEDDGEGMDKEKAKKCLVLGHSRKKNQLGEFGLGLKTAAESLGNYFSIMTSQKGSDEEYFLEFDNEEWTKDEKKQWADFEMHVKKGINKNKSGTKVIIDKLRIKVYPNLITKLKEQLSERFTPYIDNGEIKIKINTSWVEIKIPEIIDDSREKLEITLSNGEKIYGWYGILKVGSQKESGFNLYRYSRLIRAHEKLGYQYHPSKMWVTGELNLDPIPVTHNKREFITESRQYNDFLNKWRDLIGPILQKAQERHRQSKIKDLPEEEKETLKDNILRALNRIDEFKELAFPGDKKPIKKDKKGQLVNMEKRDKKKIATIQTVEDPIDPKTRTPRKIKKRKIRSIVIADKKFRFDWDWDRLDERLPKVGEVDEENGQVMIWLNRDFKLLNAVTVNKMYITLFVTEALAEIYADLNNKDRRIVIPLRDSTLTEIAKIATEDEELDKKQKELKKMKQLEKDIEDKKMKKEQEM